MKKYNGKLKESKNKSNLNVYIHFFIIRPFLNRDSATASATYLSSNDHSQSNIKLGSIQQRPLRFPRTINNSRKKRNAVAAKKVPFHFSIDYLHTTLNAPSFFGHSNFFNRHAREVPVTEFNLGVVRTLINAGWRY